VFKKSFLVVVLVWSAVSWAAPVYEVLPTNKPIHDLNGMIYDQAAGAAHELQKARYNQFYKQHFGEDGLWGFTRTESAYINKFSDVGDTLGDLEVDEGVVVPVNSYDLNDMISANSPLGSGLTDEKVTKMVSQYRKTFSKLPETDGWVYRVVEERIPGFDKFQEGGGRL